MACSASGFVSLRPVLVRALSASEGRKAVETLAVGGHGADPVAARWSAAAVEPARAVSRCRGSAGRLELAPVADLIG